MRSLDQVGILQKVNEYFFIKKDTNHEISTKLYSYQAVTTVMK